MTATEWLFNELWNTDKDKFTWHSILKKAKEMEDVCCSQTQHNSPKVQNKDSFGEISDEEIERFADEELGTIRTDFDFGVIQGMKWYREQLKQRQ